MDSERSWMLGDGSCFVGFGLCHLFGSMETLVVRGVLMGISSTGLENDIAGEFVVRLVCRGGFARSW